MVNRQANYIASAFSILLLLFACYTLINYLNTTNFQKNNNNLVIDPEPKDYSVTYDSVASWGKSLFQNKCASCHAIFKDMTGPSILGFERRGPWSDRKNLYEWIRNPAAFMVKNEYVKGLKEKYGAMMTAFPDLSNEEIDAICNYLKISEQMQYNNIVVIR